MNVISSSSNVIPNSLWLGNVRCSTNTNFNVSKHVNNICKKCFLELIIIHYHINILHKLSVKEVYIYLSKCFHFILQLPSLLL